MSLKLIMHEKIKIVSRLLNHTFCFVTLIVLIFSFFTMEEAKGQSSSNQWVGTWSTALQLVEPGNNPPNPGLSNNTLRQIVRISLGGDSLRMRLSNEYSSSAVTLKEVHIAVSKGGGTIDPNTDLVLYFNGNTEITMEPDSAITSDPFSFTLEARTDIAITIYFGDTSFDVTGHPGSRTTSYLLTGNEITKVDFSNAVKTDHWYIINTIDVKAPDPAAAIVVLGNSITDGRGSGTNKQNRWPDELARRLQENYGTEHVAVLNQGIGGNCVLKACLGPSAKNRFKSDVLDQNGVKWLVIFEGVNDIGGAWGAEGSAQVAKDLIAAYDDMIDEAHENGILVYGATLLPFGESSYYSTDHESARETVNEWIRNSGRFDAVIDLDEALRDPNNILKLLPEADDGDHLHPSETGHRMIAEAVNLNLFTGNSFGEDVPLVYNVENTGADCSIPVLPYIGSLLFIEPLTDPFEFSDGSKRSTRFEDWGCRRAEIKAEIEHYEIGEKPKRPEDITASYAGGILTVNVTVNGNTLVLTSEVVLPSGSGPFPAVIGMGFGSTGSLPSSIFTSRNIAQIPFNFGQVMAHSQNRGSEPINKLYPELTYMGAYSAWSWGVSRLIDGLELVSEDLNIDLERLAVTGCSFAGKMALFAGAFDERIALTIAQESGGGGAAAWRVSQTLGAVETLGATSHVWFMESMFQFSGNNVSKLPFDHHELMAMIAPRALLVLGNPDYVWLADESGYVSCKAAHEVWKAFGVPDRFGFSIVAGHNHCSLPASQYPEVEAYVEKFLLGNTTKNTNVQISPYDGVDYSRWTEWWGTGNPIFPDSPNGESQVIYFEPECATIGENWDIIADARTSGGSYVSVRPDIESVTSAPTNSEDHIVITFTAEKDTTYYLFGLMNNSTADDDSYWIKMDNGIFAMANGLGTSGWQWGRINNYLLKAGEHTLTIAYRENGAKLDKICISDFIDPPEGLGDKAENDCITGVDEVEGIGSYQLNQNFPNPSTEIKYNLPELSFVSLKIYDVLGREVAELVNEEKSAGTYSVVWDASKFASGSYVYTVKAGEFSQSKKMSLIK
jgi:(4-O-methyl)-D-glucuronate---lignin esterase